MIAYNECSCFKCNNRVYHPIIATKLYNISFVNLSSILIFKPSILTYSIRVYL
nr:MAG TPA: hypothetical protein [Caudoviricetes sp.]